jgi:hypothetical protein
MGKSGSEGDARNPDPLFRRAKSAAAERGIPLRALVREALANNQRLGW